MNGFIRKYASTKYLIPYLFALVLLLLPVFVDSNYIITIIIQCLAFAVFGMAWNILGGYGAQISWCSAAFVSIGAYTNLMLSTNSNGVLFPGQDVSISPFLTLPLGMLLSFLMATLVGYGTFRLRGPYFSIATIAFAEALRSAIQYFARFTKGAAGLYVTYKKQSLADLTFKNDTPFYYLFAILLFMALLFVYRFTKSKTGYYLSMIKGDEDATQSLGIETFKVKLRAFQISAMMMSVAGAFFGSFQTYISPFSTCGFDMSIKIGVVAIVGGISTLWGPVLGSFITIPIIEITGKLFGGMGSGTIFYGLLLIIIVIFCPKGLIHLWNLFKTKAGKPKLPPQAAVALVTPVNRKAL
ncbi:branched-chain amino acid ABC transporter permease [Breznakiellaceae bacterium SP9]